MGFPVVNGAIISCTQGGPPGSLLATQQSAVQFGGIPAATWGDAAPITNLTPCGMCVSMANPAVASATAAALGVLTPQPCVPSPIGAWISSPGPMVSGQMALMDDGKIACAYGGLISITDSAQKTVQK